jgi:hypothetical protein
MQRSWRHWLKQQRRVGRPLLRTLPVAVTALSRLLTRFAEGEDTTRGLDYRVDAIRHYLSSFATSEFGIEFEGGTKVSPTCSKRLLIALNSEPTPAVSMTINYGSVSSYRVRLSIGGWSRKALSASILGSRADIAHSRDLLDRTMANASPPTSWLYSKWTKRTLVASVWSLWLFLGLALFVYATTRSGLPVNTLTSVIMLPYGMAIAVLADQCQSGTRRCFRLSILDSARLPEEEYQHGQRSCGQLHL